MDKNKDVLYKKVGRKYIPVSEYASFDYLQEGHWLVNIQPSSKSYRYKLAPEVEYPNLAAALEEFSDILSNELYESGKLRPINTKMSKKEQEAWAAFHKVIGKNIPNWLSFGYGSSHDMAKQVLNRFKEKVLEKYDNKTVGQPNQPSPNF
jgi:hypothetical protein